MFLFKRAVASVDSNNFFLNHRYHLPTITNDVVLSSANPSKLQIFLNLPKVGSSDHVLVFQA